jgi:HSP20 family protein
MAVMRFDPFREVDRLAEQLGAGPRAAPRSFPMDAFRRGDQVLVHLDLPGVEPDAVELTAEQNVLTITAERRFDPQEADEVLVAERPQGRFTRQLLLGENLDVDSTQASYENGVLTLTIPVAEQAKPRRIEISGSGGGPTTIEANREESA